MKLFISSDLHGSAYYTSLMLNCFEKEKADKLVLLGDILYHGPRNDLPRDYNPKKVIELLNPLKDRILAVRGNCEAEVDDMVLSFNVKSEYMSILTETATFLATHGHRENAPVANGEFLLCGHTHIPTLEHREGYIYINPGSVSIPKEGSPHSYMTFDGKTLRWFDMEENECYIEYTIDNKKA